MNKKLLNYGLILFVISFVILSCEIDNSLKEDDFEPNDSEEKATLITSLDSINGYLEESDVDFFQFESERNYIDITRLNIYNHESRNELEVRIFDKYMDEMAKVIGARGQDLQLRFANPGGTYFFKLKSYNDETGQYDMTVDELNANDDTEPDDALEEGRIIDAYPSGQLWGRFLTDGDYSEIDYECFRVTVKASKRVDFDVIPASSQVAVKLEFFNANKDLVNIVEKQPGESITTTYVYNSGSTDSYIYLRLSGTVPDYGGDYRISFEETNYTGKKSGVGIEN